VILKEWFIMSCSLRTKPGMPPNTASNSIDLRKAVQQKRSELVNKRGVIFHNDNARSHTSLHTCEKLLEFSWDVLPHPPDFAPSDYHFFRSLQNFLDEKYFPNPNAIKIHLQWFFA